MTSKKGDEKSIRGPKKQTLASIVSKEQFQEKIKFDKENENSKCSMGLCSNVNTKNMAKNKPFYE